ncbi:ATP-binding protein [Aliifodinibius sp. S!AR15-10]|nr:ATP-binding protein [Aliifodinibius sp. S!AR15-10]
MPRVFGFAASYVVITLIGLNKGWSTWNYALLGLYFLLYPHFVYLASKVLSGKKKIEMRAMMVDAFMLGYVTAYIHFSAWMSFAFLAATILNSIMVGGGRQLAIGLGLYLSGILAFATINSLVFEPDAPFYIEIIAMISILLYIISIASTFYAQTRSLANIRMELEKKNKALEEALKELEITRSELLEKAHKAGMADVATGVLHNVGNILTSINVSTSITRDILRNSKIAKFKQANKKLKENIDDFTFSNPQNELLLNYFLKLEEPLEKEYDRLKEQNNRLTEKVNLINEVIAAQQDFSKADIITEEINIRDLVEKAFTLQSAEFKQQNIKIKRDYHDIELVKIEKTKAMHVLFNLLNNARDAMKEGKNEDNILKVKCWQDDEFVHLSITDNGVGIRKENLSKVFTHGFTTKRRGHGFGLHTCANYMKGMKGKISAESEGIGHGATFTISFAKQRESKSAGKEEDVKDRTPQE